jgi:hypothetical protein
MPAPSLPLFTAMPLERRTLAQLPLGAVSSPAIEILPVQDRCFPITLSYT